LPAGALDIDYTARELTTAEYAWEVFQRAGMLGPMQKLVDFDEASDHNKSVFLNALGPITEATAMVLDEGFDEFLIRYSPGMASSSPLRQEYGPAIRSAFTINEE